MGAGSLAGSWVRLEVGMDFSANRELYSALPPFDGGVLQMITAGGVMTQDRLFRHGDQIDGVPRASTGVSRGINRVPGGTPGYHWGTPGYH